MINGYVNEFEIINYLNGKRKKEINVIFDDIIEKLFPNIDDNDLIKAYKYGKFAKVDMVLEVNGIKKGVSIKCGSKNSVHVERIDSFVKYLQKFNFSSINELLGYLYSDGTLNNTGDNRISSYEYKLNHENEILEINNELEIKKIKEGLIYRFLICSDVNYKVKVDCFIYGTKNDFLWATSSEVLEYLNNKDSFISSGVHVSSLFIQQWNKNLVRNPKYEYCREYIQVKWFSLFDDMIQVMCMRQNRNSLSNSKN